MLVWSALRAIVVYDINLRFAHRGRGTFLCSHKEKYPKEMRPGRFAPRIKREGYPALLASLGAAQLARKWRSAKSADLHFLSLEQCFASGPQACSGARLALRGSTSKAVLGPRFARPDQHTTARQRPDQTLEVARML